MNGPIVVLIAEDDVLVRNVIQTVLTRASYSVLVACDGVEALTLAREYEGEIHLLVSDVTMPNMDGITLVARFRTERPGTPALLISGKMSSQVVRTAPGFEFMRKPFRPSELKEKIAQMLAGVSGGVPSSSGRTSSADPDSGSA